MITFCVNNRFNGSFAVGKQRSLEVQGPINLRIHTQEHLHSRSLTLKNTYTQENLTVSDYYETEK